MAEKSDPPQPATTSVSFASQKRGDVWSHFEKKTVDGGESVVGRRCKKQQKNLDGTSTMREHWHWKHAWAAASGQESRLATTISRFIGRSGYVSGLESER